MAGMATKNLRLYKCSDGYYRTSWRDEAGNHLHRSFGKQPATARDRFSAFCTRWTSDRAIRNPLDITELSIRQAWERFEAHAKEYYRDAQGNDTGEAKCFRLAMAPVLELAGELRPRQFSLTLLKAVRVKMVQSDLCVNSINARMRRLRHVWRWFVESEMCEASVWHAMQALRPLAKGRPVEIAPDEFKSPRISEEVKPVPDPYVAQVAQALPPTLAAMVWFQYYTGARPGEVCRLRPLDIDTTGKVWIFRPGKHKTAHHDKARTVLIGPRARQYIEPFMARDLTSPIFSPSEAHRQRMDERSAGKPWANWPSYQARREQRIGRGGDRYDPRGYARAIARACEDLGIPAWSPNQLRHNAATRLRKQFGLDVAQVVLGHSRADVTQLYAEVDLDKAVVAMEAVG